MNPTLNAFTVLIERRITPRELCLAALLAAAFVLRRVQGLLPAAGG
jgi:hypothetical protein